MTGAHPLCGRRLANEAGCLSLGRTRRATSRAFRRGRAACPKGVGRHRPVVARQLASYSLQISRQDRHLRSRPNLDHSTRPRRPHDAMSAGCGSCDAHAMAQVGCNSPCQERSSDRQAAGLRQVLLDRQQRGIRDVQDERFPGAIARLLRNGDLAAIQVAVHGSVDGGQAQGGPRRGSDGQPGFSAVG